MGEQTRNQEKRRKTTKKHKKTNDNKKKIMTIKIVKNARDKPVTVKEET